MALAQNAKLKNARNNIQSATETRREAFTKYFPTVSAMGAGFNANKATTAMSLQPGMELTLLKNGVTGSITAMQPVFAGGQIVNANKLACLGEEVSRIQLKQTENEVKLTTDTYFWQIVALQEKQHTVASVDSMLTRLESDVQVAVNAGITTRNDLLQVQLKQNETAATAITLRNGVDVCKMLLAQYIGADSTNFNLLTILSLDQLPPAPTPLYRAPSVALGETPEFRLLDKNVEANRLQQKLAVGKNLPSVAVGAGYMYHDFMDKGRSFGLVMATVSVPISDWWGGTHAVRRQKLAVTNAENDLHDNAQLLVIRMNKSWNDLTDAYKQLQIARKSIEQSTENLRLHTDYYHAGTATMSDLLEAQTLYQQSRDRYVDAYCTYQTKQTEYLLATGR